MNDDLTLLTSSLLVVPVAATAAGITVAARDGVVEYIAAHALYAAGTLHELHTADDHYLHLRLYIIQVPPPKAEGLIRLQAGGKPL